MDFDFKFADILLTGLERLHFVESKSSVFQGGGCGYCSLLGKEVLCFLFILNVQQNIIVIRHST